MNFSLTRTHSMEVVHCFKLKKQQIPTLSKPCCRFSRNAAKVARKNIVLTVKKYAYMIINDNNNRIIKYPNKTEFHFEKKFTDALIQRMRCFVIKVNYSRGDFPDTSAEKMDAGWDIL